MESSWMIFPLGPGLFSEAFAVSFRGCTSACVKHPKRVLPFKPTHMRTTKFATPTRDPIGNSAISVVSLKRGVLNPFPNILQKAAPQSVRIIHLYRCTQIFCNLKRCNRQHSVTQTHETCWESVSSDTKGHSQHDTVRWRQVPF